MAMSKKNRPTANMGIVRGVCLFVCSPSLAIALGIWVGYNHGWGWGVLWGVIGLIVLIVQAIKTGTSMTVCEVTVWDCILPVIISIVCGITFAPVHLFAANFFSAFTCIGAGIFFSIALIMFRVGALEPWALYLSMATFLYEALPINLPTDLDDFLCFGGTGVSLIVGRIKRQVAMGIGKYVGQKAFTALKLEADDSIPADSFEQNDEDSLIIQDDATNLLAIVQPSGSMRKKGRTTESMCKCLQCGHKLMPDDLFCPMCGSPVEV